MMIIPGIVSVLYLRSAPRKPLDSVAILPFLHSPDEAPLDSVSSQITEEVYERLVQLSSLSVSRIEDAADYVEGTKSAQVMGHDRGVRAVVLGRIEWSNGRIRVYVELIDAGDGAVLWSRQYQLNDEGDADFASTEIAGHLAAYFSSQ
jgi:TolB-like protein